MTLRAYLENNGLTVGRFSRSSGIPLGTLRAIIGGSTPLVTTAVAIEDATHGVVTCRALAGRQADEPRHPST